CPAEDSFARLRSVAGRQYAFPRHPCKRRADPRSLVRSGKTPVYTGFLSATLPAADCLLAKFPHSVLSAYRTSADAPQICGASATTPAASHRADPRSCSVTHPVPTPYTYTGSIGTLGPDLEIAAVSTSGYPA